MAILISNCWSVWIRKTASANHSNDISIYLQYAAINFTKLSISKRFNHVYLFPIDLIIRWQNIGIISIRIIIIVIIVIYQTTEKNISIMKIVLMSFYSVEIWNPMDEQQEKQVVMMIHEMSMMDDRQSCIARVNAYYDWPTCNIHRSEQQHHLHRRAMENWALKSKYPFELV